VSSLRQILGQMGIAADLPADPPTSPVVSDRTDVAKLLSGMAYDDIADLLDALLGQLSSLRGQLRQAQVDRDRWRQRAEALGYVNEDL